MLKAVLLGCLPVAFPVAGALSPVTGGSGTAAAAPAGTMSGGSPASAGASLAGGALTSRAGLRPPRNPSKSLPPSPDFLASASCLHPNTAGCDTVVLRAVTHARSVLERMGRMTFSVKAFLKLTRDEQLFVVADLERVQRGLPPARLLTKSLDHIAQVGANENEDPPFGLLPTTLPGGGLVVSAGANWASGFLNPLGSDYGWMYDDGLGSPNIDCTKSNTSGCWGHRDNILHTYATDRICGGSMPHWTVMGAGYTAPMSTRRDSETELFVGVCGKAPTDVVARWATLRRELGIK